MSRGKPSELYRKFTEPYLNYWGGNTGTLAQSQFEEATSAASRELRDRINSLFRHWEHEHGFQRGAGEILLPAGYNPERQQEAA